MKREKHPVIPPAGAPTGSEFTHRKAITRDRIVRAAMALFATQGFEHASVTQIARRAGVSRASIFWHFGDKATLFSETCREFLVPFRDMLAASLDHVDAEKRLSELFAVYEDFVTSNREAIQSFVRWMFESPELRNTLQRTLLDLHEIFMRDVRDTLREVLPPGHDAETLATGVVSLLDGNLLLSLLDPTPTGDERRRQALRAVAALIPQRPRKG
jgi:AcrR family transcriptional regulator